MSGDHVPLGPRRRKSRLGRMLELEELVRAVEPIPMRLTCPLCGRSDLSPRRWECRSVTEYVSPQHKRSPGGSWCPGSYLPMEYRRVR